MEKNVAHHKDEVITQLLDTMSDIKAKVHMNLRN